LGCALAPRAKLDGADIKMAHKPANMLVTMSLLLQSGLGTWAAGWYIINCHLYLVLDDRESRLRIDLPASVY
jgi:hypothetical protein